VAVSGRTRASRAVFLFHGSAELRRVRNRPRRGSRVKSGQGHDWIVADVLQSGVDTYTVTCVAPQEFESRRDRVVAYVRRDREFVLCMLLWVPLALVTLSLALSVWASIVLVVVAAGAVWFAWATK
jgi:hypothetical protein